MEYRQIEVKSNDVRGIAPGMQIHYHAPTARLLALELSLLAHREFDHISFLPPPEYVHIDPKQVQLKAPVSETTGVYRQPNSADIRIAIQNALIENSGFFINGNRVRRSFNVKNSSPENTR